MIKHFIINKYIGKEFIKIVFNMSCIFFFLGFILNLFEEINFFKDFDVGIKMPILLSILFVPNLLYNMFPFIILLSGIWFFLKIKKNDEIIALKISGLSNISVLIIPSILSIVIGIFFITMFNPITSTFVKKYEIIKGSYERDQDYLAAITVNGIWIKEKRLGVNNIIKSTKLEKNNLLEVSIYQFDNNDNFIKRIEAKSADISSEEWIIKDAKIINDEGKIIAENIKEISYRSVYDINKIKSIYSNLDTISFWQLNDEIKLLEERGYSSREMRAKFQESLAFPCFLLSMVLLSGVFTLGIGFKENTWNYIFISIITSVLVFYFNRFSAALGKTDKLPIEVSVWMPIVIIFIFSAIGLIHANQK